MQFSDLISKEASSEVETVNESIYDEACKLISESKFQAFDFKKFHAKMHRKMIWASKGETNTWKVLEEYKPTHPWVKRDFGREVLGKPNAKELMSLVGDFKTFYGEIVRLKKAYKDMLDEWNNMIVSIKKEVALVKDDDTEGKGAGLKKRYLAGFKKYIETQNSLDKESQHYVPSFYRAVEKVKKFESLLASTNSKQEASASRVAEKTAKKVESSAKMDDWKNKVRSRVRFNSVKTNKKDDTTGAEG